MRLLRSRRLKPMPENQKIIAFTLSVPILMLMSIASLLSLGSGGIFVEAIAFLLFEILFVWSVRCSPSRRHAYSLVLLSLACHVIFCGVLMLPLLKSIDTGFMVAVAVTEVTFAFIFLTVVVIQAGMLVSRLLLSEEIAAET